MGQSGIDGGEIMGTKFVTCRRDFGAIGEHNYCAKSIKKANGLDWCDECLKRIPIWPSGEVAEVLIQLKHDELESGEGI